MGQGPEGATKGTDAPEVAMSGRIKALGYGKEPVASGVTSANSLSAKEGN